MTCGDLEQCGHWLGLSKPGCRWSIQERLGQWSCCCRRVQQRQPICVCRWVFCTQNCVVGCSYRHSGVCSDEILYHSFRNSTHPLCMFLARSFVAFEEANYKISNVLPDRQALMHDGLGSYMGAFGDLSLWSYWKWTDIGLVEDFFESWLRDFLSMSSPGSCRSWSSRTIFLKVVDCSCSFKLLFNSVDGRWNGTLDWGNATRNRHLTSTWE